VQLISPEGQRDETALAIYFADPAAGDTKRKGSTGPLPNAINPEPPPFPDIPKPRPKPVRVVPLKDGFSVRVVANPDVKTSFPLQCEAEMAYATTTGDAYKLWDAADFWLNQEDRFPVVGAGIEGLERDGNILNFVLIGEGSELTVSGFDPRRQLDIRLKYREAANEADIPNN
jgi:hypothetical protein